MKRYERTTRKPTMIKAVHHATQSSSELLAICAKYWNELANSYYLGHEEVHFDADDVFLAMGVLNHFLDIYKETNEVKTKTKENDKIENNNVEESDDDKTDNDCVILSNPNAWKSVKE